MTPCSDVRDESRLTNSDLNSNVYNSVNGTGNVHNDNISSVVNMITLSDFRDESCLTNSDLNSNVYNSVNGTGNVHNDNTCISSVVNMTTLSDVRDESRLTNSDLNSNVYIIANGAGNVHNDNISSVVNMTTLSDFGDESRHTNSDLNSNFDNGVNRANNVQDDSSRTGLTLGLQRKALNVGHFNIQGLVGKIDDLKVILSQENNVHMLGVSESNLKAHHPASSFSIPGYQKQFRRDREGAGGGLLVYVRDDVSCTRKIDLESKEIDCIWTEIYPKNNKSFLVGHFYREPSAKTVWTEHFENNIEKVLEHQQEFYVLGDFNKNLLNKHIKTNWYNVIESLGITQIIKCPTRITDQSQTLLDHIYCSSEANVVNVSVPKLGLSDHFPIFFTRKINANVSKSSVHKTITYRSFNNFNEESFISDLNSVPWQTAFVFDDTSDILDSWCKLFMDIVDKHVPQKEHRVKHTNQPQWLNPEILDAIKMRDRLKAAGNDEHKIWRNKVINLIKQSKKQLYQTQLDKKNNPNAIWIFFNAFGAGKKGSSPQNINCLLNDGNTIENPQDIANIFNEFFVNIAAKIKEPIHHSHHENLSRFCDDKIPADSYFDIPLINNEYVEKTLKDIDTTKATGLDNIGPRLLKVAAQSISDSLTRIINHSITTSNFPDKWKEAKVTPLHKSGSCFDVNNFRPISILPTLSKVFEKHVHNSLMLYLSNFNLLCKTQSGFRQGHSCETALVGMIDRFLTALDNGSLIGMVMVDFKKAFDLVDHDVLLNKLKIYKLSENALKWFNTYLKNRKQKVKIGNSMSEDKTVLCGVPQGSILGPLLFLMFINDLPLYTNVSTDLYADDTTLYNINKSKDEIERNLQNGLNSLDLWCKNNGMLLNTAKTKVMLITTRQKRNVMANDNLSLMYKDDNLQMTMHDKVLGVHVNNNLTWTNHINMLSKKISTNIWLLSKIKEYLPLSYRVTYYKAFIQPHIDFCNVVWGSTSVSNINRISRLQKRACKTMFGYNVDNISEQMKLVNILSVEERILLRKAKFMYKVTANETPTYISEMFKYREIANNAPMLRSTTSKNFILPRPHIEIFKQSMSFSGTVIWNCLPTDVKCSSTASSFHSKCVKWLKCK
ncbi:MAG: reverse transcriptase family protein [Sedimenticola sp.]